MSEFSWNFPKLADQWAGQFVGQQLRREIQTGGLFFALACKRAARLYRYSVTLYSTNRRGLGIVHHYSPVRAQLQSICRSDGIQSVEQWAQPRVHDREQVNEISQMLETRLNGILMTSLMGHQLTTTKAHLANPNSMQRQTRRETLCQVRLLF